MLQFIGFLPHVKDCVDFKTKGKIDKHTIRLLDEIQNLKFKIMKIDLMTTSEAFQQMKFDTLLIESKQTEI